MPCCLYFVCKMNKYHVGCEAQLAAKYIFTPTFRQALLTCKVSYTDLVLECD